MKTALQCSIHKYRLMVHGEETFNTIHRMGRLFQQYIVDMYTKIEFQCLQYIRNHQGDLRAELYHGLTDAIQNSDGHIDAQTLERR